MNYIDDVLLDARSLIDCLKETKEYYDKHGYFTCFNYKFSDLKRLKMFLLSSLFTQNFDELIETSDDELKRMILDDEPISRRESDFSFENGGHFKTGEGITLKSIPGWINSTEYSKILTEIRNGVAHSYYDYDEGIIKNLNAHRNHFQSECDVDWLEMMVLCLFANRQSTYKKGAIDLQVEGVVSYPYKGEDYNLYLIEVENGADDEYNFFQKIVRKDNTIKEMIENPYLRRIAETDEKIFEACYEACDLKIKGMKKIVGVNDEILEKVDEDIYKTMNIYRRARLVRSRVQYYFDKEKRNTIGYKNTLELLHISKAAIRKQKQRLIDTGVEFMLDPIFEYTFKSYINFVYNYMLEKVGYDMSGLDLSKLNFITYSDNKPLERHIRNSCCHDRIEFRGDKVYLYDQTNSGTVNFEMECTIDDFLKLSDELVKKLKKQGLISADIDSVIKSSKR